MEKSIEDKRTEFFADVHQMAIKHFGERPIVVGLTFTSEEGFRMAAFGNTNNQSLVDLHTYMVCHTLETKHAFSLKRIEELLQVGGRTIEDFLAAKKNGEIVNNE